MVGRDRSRVRSGVFRACTGLFLSAVMLGGNAQANGYELTAGMGYTVCERFKEQLEGRTGDDPMTCSVELGDNPGGFSRPDWEELPLDDPENFELFRKLDPIARGLVHAVRPMREELTREEWLKDFHEHASRPDMHPRLLKARLGLEGSTRKETVLAVTWGTERCEAGETFGGLSGPYSLFMYDEERGTVDLDATRQNPLGFSKTFDVLVFQGRAFFFAMSYNRLTPSAAIQIETFYRRHSRADAGTITRCRYEMNFPGKGE